MGLNRVCWHTFGCQCAWRVRVLWWGMLFLTVTSYRIILVVELNTCPGENTAAGQLQVISPSLSSLVSKDIPISCLENGDNFLGKTECDCCAVVLAGFNTRVVYSQMFVYPWIHTCVYSARILRRRKTQKHVLCVVLFYDQRKMPFTCQC